MKVKTKTQWHAVLLIIGQIRGKRNSYESRFQFQMINVWQYIEWHCFHFLFSQRLMIRDDTADLRSYDEGSIRWQSEMTSCHGVALFTEKVYDVTIRRREVPSFHLSHRESWVLSHQRSKMFEHVNIVVTAGVVTQNSSEWRLVPQSFLAHLSWNHKWAFSGILLFVLCPFVCKCFWLYLLNHLPWHKVS